MGMRLNVKKRPLNGVLVLTKRKAKLTPIRKVNNVVPTAKIELFIRSSTVRGLVRTLE